MHKNCLKTDNIQVIPDVKCNVKVKACTYLFCIFLIISVIWNVIIEMILHETLFPYHAHLSDTCSINFEGLFTLKGQLCCSSTIAVKQVSIVVKHVIDVTFRVF